MRYCTRMARKHVYNNRLTVYLTDKQWQALAIAVSADDTADSTSDYIRSLIDKACAVRTQDGNGAHSAPAVASPFPVQRLR
jgi:hypothetical protein